MSEENNATVIRFEALPDCLFRIWIKPDWATGQVSWRAGQFLSLGILDDSFGRKTLRAMTIIDVQDGVFEFFMVAVSDGVTSPRIAQLRPGARCFMDPRISGNFQLDHAPYWEGADLWMLGTGTGIAPYLAMLKHERERLQRYRKLILVHSVRSEPHLCYREEIQENTVHYASFHYIPVVTRSPVSLSGDILPMRMDALIASGQLSQHAGVVISATDSIFLLCGNPGMIKAVLPILQEKGLTKHRRRKPGNIMSERYF